MKKSIMFVCHGNICRSPMAEFIMKKLVSDAGLKEKYSIASAATSTEEIGNNMYPPAQRELQKHGIPFLKRSAVQVKRSDYDQYYLFVVMDNNNLSNILRIFGSDNDKKVHKLLAFAGTDRDVSDPWYTDRFDITYKDILAGCQGLLEWLERQEAYYHKRS